MRAAPQQDPQQLSYLSQHQPFESRATLSQALARLEQDPDVQTLRQHMLTVLNGIETLRHRVPEWPWDNPVGDIGEYVACTLLGMERAPSGQKGYDVTHDGKTIQIKTMFKGNMPGFRGQCDEFMMFQLDATGLPRIEYMGAFDEVNEHSKYSKADNKRTISLTKIRDLFKFSNTSMRKKVERYNAIIRERQAEILPVLHVLQSIFAARAAMKEFTDKIDQENGRTLSSYSWTNPVADFGELLAVKLGMTKAPLGQKGYDVIHNGYLTQVKTCLHGSTVGLRKSSQEAHALLALALMPCVETVPSNDPKNPHPKKQITGLTFRVDYAGPMSWVMARLGALNPDVDMKNWDNKLSLPVNTLQKMGYAQDILHATPMLPETRDGLLNQVQRMLDAGWYSREDARAEMDKLMHLAMMADNAQLLGSDEAHALVHHASPAASVVPSTRRNGKGR